MIVDPEDILRFWFPEQPLRIEVLKKASKRWFTKDADFDTQIRTQFGATLQAAMEHRLQQWQEQPRSCLALVIVLDQFSRNLFRDSTQAFSNDLAAQALTKLALERQLDADFHCFEKQFLIMPFVHAEDLILQNQAVSYIHETTDEVPEDLLSVWQMVEQSFKEHRDTIAEFGRFPHRNKVLQRDSTPEELEYLAKGKGFGA
jgi:uncharacterized protein (DUF924 family)